MISFLPAFLLPVLLGFALVSLLWDRSQGLLNGVLLKASLSVGLGFGLTSALFFAWIVLAGRFGTGFILLETGVLLALAGIILLTTVRSAGFRLFRSEESNRRSAPRWVFSLGFCGILALAMLAFLYLSLNRPHGGWDAWAMWNMRARFLFRGGEHWRDVFSVLGELHPDYPLLVPGIVARLWGYLGRDPVFIPALTSAGFTIATVCLLASSLNLLRGGSQGYVAGVAMFVATEFTRQSASQYADVYIGFFLLAALVLVSLAAEREGESPGMTVLAGVAAALAAWTKNEGILFLALFFAGTVAGVAKDGFKAVLRRLALLSAGALPVVLVVFYFKIGLAPATDILAEQTAGAMLGRLLDPSRYATVSKAFLLACTWKFLLPVLVAYLLLLGIDRAQIRANGFLVSAGTVLAMFASYFLVYVTTSKPLQWHLTFSLDRILVQLWPSFLFVFFLLARTPESLLATATAAPQKGAPAGKAAKDRQPNRGKQKPSRKKGRA